MGVGWFHWTSRTLSIYEVIYEVHQEPFYRRSAVVRFQRSTSAPQSDSCRVSTGSFCQYRLLTSLNCIKWLIVFIHAECFGFTLMNFSEPQNNESKQNFVGHHTQPRLHLQSYEAEGFILSRLTKNRQMQKHFSTASPSWLRLHLWSQDRPTVR